MEENPDRLRIGVCGVGSIGSRHARLLSVRTNVDVYLCDTTGAHLDAAAGLANVSGSTRSFDDLIISGLDGLIIATPDRFHVEQAEAACRAGIAVLLEKPIAETAQLGERLQNCTEETGTNVLVGYPLRYNSIFLKGKEIIETGLIGTPVSFHVMLGAYNTLVAARNRFHSAERNKLFVDYSHEWDYINWFLGKISRVAAVAHQSGDLELTQDPNVIDGILELDGGVSGTAHLDYVQVPGRRAFTVIGDKGTVVIDSVAGLVSVQIYKEDFARVFHIVESFDAMLERQHHHFLDVVRGAAKPKVTVADGVSALRVADAMLSACENGAWVVV